ncbi:MAG: gliding motility-associated ABC transporter ATP-binding subunit GldA [Candidatus Dojkabacteria bacterium]|nr:MAG: gliding motility-associated ABC transporter ATP-binding subunit GldA [Candidatus Dojkabacteria bacterium]
MQSMGLVLEVKNVTKNYGKVRALDDISFTVKAGEVVALLGPNGAGKSTLMKLISGFLIPDTGEVRVCGYSTYKDILSVQKKIGYMPENNPLYPHLTVIESLNNSLNLHGVWGRKRKEALEYAIESTGLQNYLNKSVATLSKGYKQRVGLAQVLVVDPELLLLDEPTEGLDPIQRIEIRNVIKEIGKKRTVLISTHVMQEVEAMCSRVLIIAKGKLLVDKSIKSIKTTINQKNITLEKLFCEIVLKAYENKNT